MCRFLVMRLLGVASAEPLQPASCFIYCYSKISCNERSVLDSWTDSVVC
ncbi:hypothetical protein E2C01_008399 [Portunus trituberculatus]|uniref:Uncharacterized protein n=1 Tax=Portunus trituberculatus TaxID=210409 RepID=A0A5B7D1R9_PORTR|nr:hypothetical protein [Portunus trituberculatus]